MRVYPEQFADHLKAGLKPCYLVFGDEPLLKLEAIAVGVNQEIMQGITVEEEQQLINILTRMKLNLKAMDAVPTSTVGRKTDDED